MDIVSIGEPLAEFTSDAARPDLFQRRPGGDMLNAAIYLARLRPDLRVGYLSRLGDDAMSRWMRAAIAAEGVDVSRIGEEPGGRPGLSFVQTDPTGERSFTYWRDQAPARRMFGADGAEVATLGSPRCILFSGVTLAILPAAARTRLLSALSALRERGCLIAYDTNYRPILWSAPEEAAEWTGRALATASVALPSAEDLAILYGETDPEAALALCARQSSGEVVLTTGGGTVLHHDPASGVTPIALPPPVPAVDTTAAGDSFDAGFLSARLRGLDPKAAVLAGARLAALVVQWPGAVIPVEAMLEEIAAHAV